MLNKFPVTETNINHWSALLKNKISAIENEYDISHKMDHFERVVKMTYQLSIEERADIRITIPAAWLHDCYPVKKNDPKNKIASTLSSQQAIKILEEIAYPDEFYDDIFHAIAAHSFSGGIEPQTIEAKVVQDADRLDALGSIGIARTLMLGANLNNFLYHPQEPFPVKRTIDDKKYIIDHFYRKLFHIAKTLTTRTGKKEAEQRILIMEAFINQLKNEV